MAKVEIWALASEGDSDVGLSDFWEEIKITESNDQYIIDFLKYRISRPIRKIKINKKLDKETQIKKYFERYILEDQGIESILSPNDIELMNNISKQQYEEEMKDDELLKDYEEDDYC